MGGLGMGGGWTRVAVGRDGIKGCINVTAGMDAGSDCRKRDGISG